MEIAITGASGFIGTALQEHLRSLGHRPISLVRRSPRPHEDEIYWQPATNEIDAASLEGVDALVHLAGAGIGDKRWTDSYRRLLRSSRVEATSFLTETLANLNRPPRRLVSGSAIGFYGNRGAEKLSESSGPGAGFLPELVADWEAATRPAVDAGIATTSVRTGIVLDPSGGALAKMLPLFRFGLGGRLGSGEQYMAWISRHDAVRALAALTTTEPLSAIAGPVNLTAPTPVNNATFTQALGTRLGRPTLLPVPAFAPKLLLGADMAQALLFDSANVVPTALLEAGFSFEHATIDAAFAAMFP